MRAKDLSGFSAWTARWAGATWAGLTLVLLASSGCGHHRTTARYPAPQAAPPEVQPAQPRYPETRSATKPEVAIGRIPITPVPVGGISDDDREFVLTHRPIFSEEGDASWYTAPYRGRKAANGQVFDDDALTAAHRTLPMGSLIVVTNLKTRQASAMRITDRGPFRPDKIIDLTIASAKSIGIYRSGTAPVRIDVYETPKPMDYGGRWCVQIGAFTSERKAEELKQELLRKYPEAHVIEFPGEKSYWVRIRPEGDDRERAESIAEHLHPSEGDAYLTRLD
ncbi:MAG TPA: septal ring lytic transglycosylase RlpA family protein [Terracidiphilus sp.]|jgi:rare lipoprotein A|nr:septal ring lytic transglycosylase RlpA family protein [Terracidiphilus sp.]